VAQRPTVDTADADHWRRPVRWLLDSTQASRPPRRLNHTTARLAPSPPCPAARRPVGLPKSLDHSARHLPPFALHFAAIPAQPFPTAGHRAARAPSATGCPRPGASRRPRPPPPSHRHLPAPLPATSQRPPPATSRLAPARDPPGWPPPATSRLAPALSLPGDPRPVTSRQSPARHFRATPARHFSATPATLPGDPHRAADCARLTSLETADPGAPVPRGRAVTPPGTRTHGPWTPRPISQRPRAPPCPRQSHHSRLPGAV
jgi:hypothetical protein